MGAVPWPRSDANGCQEAPWQDGVTVGREQGPAGRSSMQNTALSLGNF